MQGDLFSCRDSESLAHCISADARMGKGIAVLFKRKFGGVDEILTQGNNDYKVNNYIIYMIIIYCISPMNTCFINPLVTEPGSHVPK